MFHSRALNNEMNWLQERCLQIVYSDHKSSYEELLEKDNSVSIHYRNLHSLAIDLYKVLNGLSPIFMEEVFSIKAEVSI